MEFNSIQAKQDLDMPPTEGIRTNELRIGIAYTRPFYHFELDGHFLLYFLRRDFISQIRFKNFAGSVLGFDDSLEIIRGGDNIIINGADHKDFPEIVLRNTVFSPIQHNVLEFQ